MDFRHMPPLLSNRLGVNTIHGVICCLWYSPWYHICDTYFGYFIYTGIINWWRLKRQVYWLDWLLYIVWFDFKNKSIPNFESTESSQLCWVFFRTLLHCSFMYLYCTQSQFPSDFQCDFQPLEQACVSIQAPVIWYMYHQHLWCIDALINQCTPTHQVTSRALMEGINMEKSSQGCYKAMQLSQ